MFSIIVCGKFHYHYYVKYLERNLRQIYFSHRISESFSVPKFKRSNLFVKEYAVGFHLRAFGRRYFNYFVRVYHLIWKASLYFSYKNDNLNMVMLHGNCGALISRIKKNGGVVIGDAVTLHPVVSKKIIDSECGRLGVLPKKDLAFDEKLYEIGLVDYILCPSRAVYDSYVDSGYSPSRIFISSYGVPDGVSASLKKYLGADSNNIKSPVDGIFKVLCVGQISVGKGQFHLIQAIKRLAETGVHVRLKLVGRHDLDYLNLLNGIDFSFEHVSHLSHDSVLDEMSNTDVFCLFSLEDGFGMVVTEAMSVGTPVVVSKFAGVSEVVDSCGGGFVVDPFDHLDCARKIEACIAGNYPKLASIPKSWHEYADDVCRIVNGLK